MAVRRYPYFLGTNTPASIPPVSFYECDAAAELPVTGVSRGDTAYAIDTNLSYFYDGTTWTAMGGGGGGGGINATRIGDGTFGLNPSQKTSIASFTPLPPNVYMPVLSMTGGNPTQQLSQGNTLVNPPNLCVFYGFEVNGGNLDLVIRASNTAGACTIYWALYEITIP